MKILLASSSPRRRDLLSEAGVSFRVLAPAVEEWEDSSADPEMLVLENARRKARAACGSAAGEETVLGADTVVVIDGIILGKPVDRCQARSMLSRLSGRCHEVLTGVCLIFPDGFEKSFVVRTSVRFFRLSREEIEGYLRDIPVLDKAGSYAIQEGGERIVESIEGSYSNVVGLPIEEVLIQLAEGSSNH